MATLKIETTITKTDTNAGSLAFSTSNSSTYTAIEDVEFSLAATTEKIVWDPTTDGAEGTTDFDRLIFISSGDCELEFTTDLNNTYGKNTSTKSLIANVPYFLGSDASRAKAVVDLTVVGAITGTTATSVTGATSGAVGVVVGVSGQLLRLSSISGLFQSGETLNIVGGDLAGTLTVGAAGVTMTTQSSFDGTLDVIDKIVAKSGSSAITLRKIIAT